MFNLPEDVNYATDVILTTSHCIYFDKYSNFNQAVTDVYMLHFLIFKIHKTEYSVVLNEIK